MIRANPALLERIHKTNRLHGLFREGDCLLLALSGGPDSAAMAGLFSIIARTRRLRLIGAHLHHGLSGQAASFEKAARQLCQRLDIPFYADRHRVAQSARRQRIGLEEAGRKARYAFLLRLARRLHADAVLTAHTQDDQAETVLFRIVRGTSIRGLSGIPYARQESGVRIIRPLLDCSKGELAAFARSARLPQVSDRSNRSARHRRNRIRHELLPLLRRRLNPSVTEALTRLQNSAQEILPHWDRQCERAWRACRPRRPRAGVLTLDRRGFRRQDNALRHELFFRAVSTLGAGQQKLGREHAQLLCAAVDRRRPEQLDYPGFCVRLNEKTLLWRLTAFR